MKILGRQFLKTSLYKVQKYKEKRIKWEILEAAVETAAIEAEASAQDETSVLQEKCTKLHVQVADRNAKFLSNQLKAGQFSAKIATPRISQNSK